MNYPFRPNLLAFLFSLWLLTTPMIFDIFRMNETEIQKLPFDAYSDAFPDEG
jgi:hypothetical protein